MQTESNGKVLGAFVIGFALIAGAYTLGNFNAPPVDYQPASVAGSKAPPRVAIEVVDEDNNGIEDWRDSFVTAEPIVVEENTVPYELPDTLTGKVGVNFIRDILSAKIYAGAGRSQEEVVSDTLNLLEQETSYRLYDLPDIQIIEQYSDEDIKNYANAMAGAVLSNDLADYENELTILNRVVNYEEKERVSELAAIAKSYAAIRDDSLAIPVPAGFVKQHLDLINTYHAVSKDIEAMSMTFEDPIVSLMRLRRYEDDVLGMQYALQNMYLALTKYPQLFTENDAALLFNSFAPQGRI